MNKVPCLNCQDRIVSCHSNCKKYLDFKKEHKILKDKINKNKQMYNDLCNCTELKFKKYKRR